MKTAILDALEARYEAHIAEADATIKIYLENYSTVDEISQQWAYLRLAQVYKNTRDKTKALFWIEKALAIAPEFEQALKEKRLIQQL